MIELPGVIEKAMSVNTYSGQHEVRYASVTELLRPAWINWLEKKHKGQYREDLRKRIWSFIGGAVHEAVHKALKDQSEILSEERLPMEIDGKTITGGVDLYYRNPETTEHILTDLKTTTMGAFKREDRRAEWVAQLNCYALLYRNAGYRVDRLSVIAIIRDQKVRDWEDPEQQPVQEIEIEDWGEERTTEWIQHRIDGRQYLESVARDPDIEEIVLYNRLGCSQEERWERPATYPVMKQGGKRASKVCTTMDEAMEYADNMHVAMGASYAIGHNPAVRARCENYCAVADYCAGHQATKGKVIK